MEQRRLEADREGCRVKSDVHFLLTTATGAIEGAVLTEKEYCAYSLVVKWARTGILVW